MKNQINMVGTNWSELYTCKKFYYDKIFEKEDVLTGKSPAKDQISILDIAHSLSMICRFNGHCHSFYSVAEHCCHVSDLCKGIKYEKNKRTGTKETKLLGLLHDAAEAYTGDIVRPIKLGLWFGVYQHQVVEFGILEQEIQSIINNKYIERLPGFKKEALIAEFEEVKRNDNRMLATEARDLMKSGGKDWNLVEKPVKNVILPMWSQQEAKFEFIKRFSKLTDGAFKKEI